MEAMTMRVLHIMSGFGGGISSFILNKSKYFKNKPIVFDVITFDEVPKHFSKAIKDTGGNVHQISNPKTNGFKSYFNEVNAIMRGLPAETFVHCHIRGYRAVPFYLVAKKNRLNRFGVHAHTTGMPEEINSFKNRRVRLINNLLANEKISCGIEASKYLFGEQQLNNKEIVHIPNSINGKDFVQYYDVNKETLLGPENKNKYVIGHIGRFYSVKNHPFMVSIIEKLAKSSLDFVWLFIGDGIDLDNVKKMVKERGLSQYVRFLGRRNDIPELLQVMDLFMLPSKYEGFPTVAVESQASGTKALLSDTITADVDLKLDLVEFLSIKDPEIWSDYILNNQTMIETTPEVRLKQLKKNNLTNKESAELYQAFLERDIEHYEMN